MTDQTSLAGDDLHADDDAALFARSGMSHPLGKLTAIEKVALPEIVSDILAERACAAKMSVAELHREVMCQWACGNNYDRILAERRRVASMNGPGIGTEGGGDARLAR